MKIMRLALCVVAFAVVGKLAMAEDVDVRTLMAQLADQEARMNDLQAKLDFNDANANIAGAPEGILSIRKNAVVTVGGTVNTRYYYHNIREIDRDGNTEAREKIGELIISDAKLEVKVDVNDHFDAYLKADLISSNSAASDNAQHYWVRWKNICNSGFGVLVGRADLAFGGLVDYGILGKWTGGDGDGIGRGTQLNEMIMHNGWDIGRVTQVTPYWEGLDGKLKVEVMFAQKVDNANGAFGSYPNARRADNVYQTADAISTYKSRNYGLGTMSARIGYTPIEGLDLQASIVNYYDKNPMSWYDPAEVTTDDLRRNNTAIDLAFNWRPCFMPKLAVFGEWVHGWDVNYFKNVDSDAFNFGLAYDFTDSFTLFAQGDYLRVKNDEGAGSRATGWASYLGAQYNFGYGVSLETGWRHESGKGRGADGTINGRIKADTVSAHLGFDF